MNRTERFYQIDQLLHEKQVVPIEHFLQVLDISRATFKRDIEYMRDRLHAPIVWDRAAGGYCFISEPGVGPRYELPGVWFSAGELYALLAAQKLLSDIEPGLLEPHLAPLQARLAATLEASGHAADQIAQRVRLLSLGKRQVEPRFFSQIANALLSRRQIEITAWNRGRDEVDVRTISPQRLVHYRDNWYLDAWCHWRQALRSFSVDAIQNLVPQSAVAIDISEAEMEAHFRSAYGIFAGTAKATAVLLFSAERARWVEKERWHRDQTGERLADGRYRLSVPYADERELLMDIQRHGAQVYVEAPESLRARLAAEARKVLAMCGEN
jgi:predicted DNA-binding transcriptional regulator YafY